MSTQGEEKFVENREVTSFTLRIGTAGVIHFVLAHHFYLKFESTCGA